MWISRPMEHHHDPLGVLYRVKPDDRLVEVIHVWKIASEVPPQTDDAWNRSGKLPACQLSRQLTSWQLVATKLDLKHYEFRR